ncbi:hypothetical protein C8J57DRAFT_969766, partial [Mycena rebaudengoi]
LHDSSESFPQPRCHPETRTKMLDDLFEWATTGILSSARGHKPNIPTELFGLHGPAGAGKSAIMRTLCQRLQDAGQLGGSFFFKRGHVTRGHGKMLFATIAYQLALKIPSLKAAISRGVYNDPSIVERNMDVQLQRLLAGPCLIPTDSGPWIVVIDGLDECEGRDNQKEILRLLCNSLSTNSLRLRLLASRPESHIEECFGNEHFKGLLEALDIEQSFEDVDKYLRDNFARIHDEHTLPTPCDYKRLQRSDTQTMATIPRPWPYEAAIQHLVDKSSGHFIYASTIIKYIDDRDYRPVERLKAVMESQATEFETPFGALDQLYTQIL